MKSSIAVSGLDAAGVRLLPPLGRLRRRWEQRHELVQAVRLVPHVLEQLVGPDAKSWSIADARWTDNRVAVVRVVPEPESPPIILKLAATVHGSQSLAREKTVLDALREIPALEEWRVRVPAVLGHGGVEKRMWLAETALPGTPARALLGDPEQRRWLLPAALTAIGQLHAQTAVVRAVESADLDTWIDEPAARLARLIGGIGRVPVLETLRNDLRSALLGRPLPIGWIHGDFWPGNLLVDSVAGTVTGIVDWDQAGAEQLPLHDILHLALYSRRLAGGGELGEIVRHALRRPDDLERWVAELQPEGPAGEAPGWLAEDHHSTVLLYWLHHVGSFAEAGGHADSRFWVRHNIEAVLEAL
jgi:aminoglycoside phosphotransferase (APT) family kinase protein